MRARHHLGTDPGALTRLAAMRNDQVDEQAESERERGHAGEKELPQIVRRREGEARRRRATSQLEGHAAEDQAEARAEAQRKDAGRRKRERSAVESDGGAVEKLGRRNHLKAIRAAARQDQARQGQPWVVERKAVHAA